MYELTKKYSPLNMEKKRKKVMRGFRKIVGKPIIFLYNRIEHRLMRFIRIYVHQLIIFEKQLPWLFSRCNQATTMQHKLLCIQLTRLPFDVRHFAAQTDTFNRVALSFIYFCSFYRNHCTMCSIRQCSIFAILS